jgi:hypothetical protein
MDFFRPKGGLVTTCVCFDEGCTKGFAEGFAKGFAKGCTKDFAEGRTKDFAEGFAEGCTKGFAEGCTKGSSSRPSNRLARFSGGASHDVSLPAVGSSAARSCIVV